MATFGQLTTRVVNKYKGSSGASFTTQAQAAINDAIEYYRREPFWFTQGTFSLTLVADEPNISSNPSWPTDFWYLLENGGLAVVQSRQRFPVRKARVEEYDLWNVEASGRPFIYRDLAGNIEVYYYPNQAYTLEGRYAKKYDALTADGAENDFTVNAAQLIEARALSMLFLSEGHDGETMKVFWENEENKQLASLRLTNNQRVATGNLATNE